MASDIEETSQKRYKMNCMYVVFVFTETKQRGRTSATSTTERKRNERVNMHIKSRKNITKLTRGRLDTNL